MQKRFWFHTYHKTLSDGGHTVYIYARNKINLEDEDSNIFFIDTVPPKVEIKQPPKIIWVPASDWPNGSYKIPISYPVDILCDVKDNIALDEVMLFVDDKLIHTRSDISKSTYVASIEVSVSTACGWKKHTLKISAKDLAGNITDYS